MIGSMHRKLKPRRENLDHRKKIFLEFKVAVYSLLLKSAQIEEWRIELLAEADITTTSIISNYLVGILSIMYFLIKNR